MNYADALAIFKSLDQGTDKTDEKGLATHGAAPEISESLGQGADKTDKRVGPENPESLGRGTDKTDKKLSEPLAFELTPPEPKAPPRKADLRLVKTDREPPPPSAGEVAAGPPPVEYAVVADLDAATAALDALAGRRVAIDLETTGVDPATAEVRLLQVAAGRACWSSTPAPAAGSRPWPARSPALAPPSRTAPCSRPPSCAGPGSARCSTALRSPSSCSPASSTCPPRSRPR